MLYTSQQINRDFRLKVDGISETGEWLHKLVGVSGLVSLIGFDFLQKFVGRAYESGLDKCVCKLRRGLVVSLYAK